MSETHFIPKGTCRLKLKGCRRIYHANGCKKKARVVILILDKIDFKTKTRDIEGHYMIMKGGIQQEDMANVNIYSFNMGASSIQTENQQGNSGFE